MQYKTMIFNANQPMVQQITEPLNSEYGVAVKVKKDGEFLPYEQVKVNEKGCDANRDGWACFALSTDNAEGMETISIEATVGTGSQDTVYTHTLTDTATVAGGGVDVEVNLSDVSGLPETISVKDVTGTVNVTGDGFSITDTIGKAMGGLPPGIPDGYTAHNVNIVSPSTGYGYVMLTDQSNNVKWAKASMTEQPPTFTIVPDATISTSDTMLVSSIYNDAIEGDVSYSANVELTVSGGEGGSSVIKFPLMVNKQDMGYIVPAEYGIQ